jgi:site-specific DNA-methyltransferase (adenine-specific)
LLQKKLDRKFIGIEQEKRYACYALQRLKSVSTDKAIQGYSGEVFWERNTLASQKHQKNSSENSGDFFLQLDSLGAAE